MKVLAIGSEKGGCGKSTTTLYLAARAAERLHSSAAHPKVAIVDRDRDGHLSRMWVRRADVRRASIVLQQGTFLPAADSGIELVLIDTPPGADALATLREAHLVVVPCPPTEWNVESLNIYLQRVSDVIRTRRLDMRLVAILPTIVKRTNLHRVNLEKMQALASMQDPPLLVLPPIPDHSEVQEPNLSTHEYDAAAEELFRYAAL